MNTYGRKYIKIATDSTITFVLPKANSLAEILELISAQGMAVIPLPELAGDDPLAQGLCLIVATRVTEDSTLAMNELASKLCNRPIAGDTLIGIMQQSKDNSFGVVGIMDSEIMHYNEYIWRKAMDIIYSRKEDQPMKETNVMEEKEEQTLQEQIDDLKLRIEFLERRMSTLERRTLEMARIVTEITERIK